MKSCPEDCDASCYRCLRSFKNKIEHSLLDRHVGAALLEYLLDGRVAEFSTARLRSSTALLYHDLQRQAPEGVQFEMEAVVSADGISVIAPILARSALGRKRIVALSAPLTPGHPADPTLSTARTSAGFVPLIVENELVVRANLPAATRRVLAQLDD